MAPNNRNTISFQGRKERILETIRVRGKRYELLEELSHRGAFRVFDRDAGPSGNYRVLYRFDACDIDQQKFETLRRLGGPKANRNFPTLIQCGRQGSNYFVLLEWVSGTNLLHLLNAIRSGKTPRPSVYEVVRLMRGLAHGLGHYHRQLNLVHGDISPANIVVTAGTKQLVLVDLGSAWPIEQSAFKSAGDGVTIPYAAPERLANHASEDFRADQFSLSAVAYELLTLRVPYDGLGGHAGLPQFGNQLEETYLAPSLNCAQTRRIPRDVTIQMDELFRRSLSLQVDQRYGTRRDWLQAWDRLHQLIQQQERLSYWERLIVRGVELVTSLGKTKRSNNRGSR